MKFLRPNSSRQVIVEELEKELKLQAERWSSVLRIDGLIPTILRNDQIRFSRPRTWKEYRRLLMVHWYLPEDSFAIVHLELEQIEFKFGMEYSIAAHAMLNSKPEMIIYLLESEMYKNERELFGSIRAPFEFRRYRFYVLRQKKAKRLIRRRGYKDQGSRRLPHEQHEAKFDFSFTEEQNRIEKERQEVQDLKAFLRGFLE